MPRAKHIAEKQCAHNFPKLEEYVGVLQAHLNLAQWKVSVVQEASDVEAWADIAPHSQADTADLRISHDFWGLSQERQRTVLVHELIHLVVSRADQVVENLEEPLGKLAWSVLSSQYEDATERAVEHMAVIVAAFVPLPEFSS
jgi:hypothetical protein